MNKKKRWYDYLWIVSTLYLLLGFVNILFGWLGMICFLVPIIMAIVTKNKTYCHKYCGRSQLFNILGEKLHLSRMKSTPKWMSSKWFRYGFFIFFMAMFANMCFLTYNVFTQVTSLKSFVTLFWTFKIPWHAISVTNNIAPWILQYAYGFYSMMLTSTLIGLILMALYMPRSWCTFCPMGTMTKLICKPYANKKNAE